MVEPEELRRRQRCHGDRRDRIDPRRDGAPEGVVDHALGKRVGRRPVVRRKAAAARPRGVFDHQRREHVEVVAARPLAEHEVHAAGELVERLDGIGALMVGDDARRRIGVEVCARHERRVPVYQAGDGVARRRDARERLPVCREDAGGVHHLAETEDLPGMRRHERAHVRRRDLGARLLVRQRRHAGGHHELDGERRAAGVLDHKREAARPRDVGDLMAVDDGARRAPRERHAGVLGGPNVGALDMEVPVDKARGEVAARAVDDLGGRGVGHGGVTVVKEHARDAPARNGHTAAHHAVAVHIDDARVGDEHVCRRAPLRHVDEVLEGIRQSRRLRHEAPPCPVALCEVYPPRREPMRGDAAAGRGPAGRGAARPSPPASPVR